MCDRESFEKIRDSIAELQKTDASHSEQIKTLFATTERQGKTIDTITARLVMAVIGVLLILVLAVVFGAIGKEGFNAVTRAAPKLAAEVAK